MSRHATRLVPRAASVRSVAKRVGDAPVLLSLVALGALLRLPVLGLGLWRDEASSYFVSVPSCIAGVIEHVLRLELNPPGYFLLLHAWLGVFGADEVALKVPSMILGLLLIPAAYWLGRLVGPWPTGLLAAGITALAPEAAFYSQEVRPYGLAALLGIGVVGFYARALATGRRRDFMGFVACGTGLLYVQYVGLLILGGLALLTLVLWARGAIELRGPAIAFCGVALLYLPWLPGALGHYLTGLPWSTGIALGEMPRQLFENVAYIIPLGSTTLRDLSAAALIAGLGVLTAMVLVRRRRLLEGFDRLVARAGPAVAAAAAIAAPATLVAGEAAAGLGDRYLYAAAPLAWVVFAAAASVGWSLLRERWPPRIRAGLREVGAAALLVGFMAINVRAALSLAAHEKSGIRALVADLPREPAGAVAYLVAPDYLASTLGYYTRHDPLNIHGFVRWEEPELFTPIGYRERWSDTAVIADTERRIAELAESGYRRLAFIKEDRGYVLAGPSVPHGVVEGLRARLAETYPLLREVDYGGTKENVTLYLFSLRPAGIEGTACVC